MTTKAIKLQKAIDAYQEANFLPFEEWNRDNPTKRIIIAVSEKEHLNYVGLIKNLSIDFSTEKVDIELTENPNEAQEFGDHIGTMLYHYLPSLIKGKYFSQHHFPVKKRTNA